MELNSILYIIYSTTSITITIIMALLFWMRHRAAGAKSMSLMMSSAALWGMSDFISDLVRLNSAKIFWDNLSYVGIAIIPVAWLIYATKYTKYGRYLKSKRLILLFIIPAVTIFMVWTNNLHHLMITEVDFITEGQMAIMSTTFGIWFWVHASYSYLLFFIGTLLLVKKLIALPKILRSQPLIILAAIFVPLFLNILYTFRVAPSYPVDPTIFSFTFTGILCFFGMFRYKLFELIPAARNAVIEDMSSILVVLDEQNHIIDINSAAKNILGIKEEDFIGEPVFDILGIWSSYFIKYEHVENVEEKIYINTASGRKCFDLRITPIIDNKNRTVGRFFILYDITTLEEAINDLEVSRRAAEEANKAKSQFLAAMSHEIRTPLNGIIGMAELMAAENHNVQGKGYLQIVQSCADSLLDIINDILDFSKIEAGKMELEKTDFQLKNLVDSVVNPFAHQAIGKDIELVCTIDHTIPEKVVGDPARIRQILVNLIGNALKFTEKGKIEVTAELLKCENDQAAVQFSVVDTGIGINEEKIDKLFNSFEQLDSSTTRKYGGTGLGLAIVKNLVTLMGGFIDVESKPGEGSKFSFTIPFVISDNKSSAAVSSPGFDFKNRNITILLADDNEVNQMLITKLLEKEKIEVDTAANGKEVLLMLEQKVYDLILMDIQMPEMDGYEAAIAIRKNEAAAGSHIPIIALTANATEEVRKMCLQVGMDDYLTKPLRTKKLFKCLSLHLAEQA